MNGAELVLLVGPAYGTEPLAAMAGPHLTRGMAVMICPGSCAGAVAFKRTVGLELDDSDNVVGEMTTLLYAVRVTEPGVGRVFHELTSGVYLSGLPLWSFVRCSRPVGRLCSDADDGEGPWKTRLMAITGVHAILYTDDAAADRAFFADVLGLTSVDAGHGWRIFALPPAELAAHPASAAGGGFELYLMCDNVEATVRELAAKGVEFSGGVTEQRWGLSTTIKLPGSGRLGLYEPRHASPIVAPS